MTDAEEPVTGDADEDEEVLRQIADGQVVLNLAYLGTGIFVAGAVAQVLVDDVIDVVTLYSVALFVAGLAAMTWAYALGVVRSRDEQIDLPGLFFLAGSAPKEVARPFRVLVVVQVVIAVIAASLQPFTNAAFGVLVPLFGLGMMALWGGRHGRFPPKLDRR